MKKFSIGIIILAFIISCSNGNKESAGNVDKTDKEKQSISIVKPENPQGTTVALNTKDFNVKGEGETANDLGDIYNGTLYYKGNIFTGKVTFDTFYSSGYFFVKDGKLEGEYEKNYKKSGIKRIDTYKNNNILSRSETRDGVTTELIFDVNSNAVHNYLLKSSIGYQELKQELSHATCLQILCEEVNHLIYHDLGNKNPLAQ